MPTSLWKVLRCDPIWIQEEFKMKKVFAVILVVCAMSIVMSGCSKSEEPAAGGAGTTTPADKPADSK